MTSLSRRLAFECGKQLFDGGIELWQDLRKIDRILVMQRTGCRRSAKAQNGPVRWIDQQRERDSMLNVPDAPTHQACDVLAWRHDLDSDIGRLGEVVGNFAFTRPDDALPAVDRNVG